MQIQSFRRLSLAQRSFGKGSSSYQRHHFRGIDSSGQTLILGMVGVLHDRQATTYSLYQEMLREDGDDVDRDKEEVEEYSSFV